MDPLTCDLCNIKFTAHKNFLRHFRAKHRNSSHACSECGLTFSRSDIYSRHMKTHKRKATSDVIQPAKHSRTDLLPLPVSQSSRPTSYAFAGRVQTVRLDNTEGFMDLKEFLLSNREDFTSLIVAELSKHELKVNCRLLCIYQKTTNSGILTEEKCFKTKNSAVLLTTNLEELFTHTCDKLLAESADFQEKESGWTLVEILSLEVRLNKYNPLRGSTYIELPAVIKRKEAVINVKNTDNRCFQWAILSALHPVIDHHMNANRTSKYEPYVHELDFTGIEFPVRLQDINKFENKNNISINVYGLDDNNKVFPLIITESEKNTHVDLLYLTSDTTSHYAWIKNLSRLVSTQLSKNKASKFICRRCLLPFGREDNLRKHEEVCKSHEAVRVEIPQDPWLSFQNIKHTLEMSFIVYADFECLTVPIDTCEPSSEHSFTNAYQKHEPSSYCYYISYCDGIYKEPVVYRGPNAARHFFQAMQREAAEIQWIYKHPKPMNDLSQAELQLYESATTCYMCGGKFTPKNHKICTIFA